MMESNMDSEKYYKSRVSPWQNKQEFDIVYGLLYGQHANNGTRSKAYEHMLMWKARRMNLTSASILSTLSILEVQVLDDKRDNKYSVNAIRSLYSNAFTRFLNYMTSIMHNHNYKTMYSTAKELGIESFLVDLRHMCAHGQVLPSIEVFRRSAIYCMNWLKSFYWDHEYKSIQDTEITNIKITFTHRFEKQLKSLIDIHDAAAEASHKNFLTVEEIDNDLVEQKSILEEYSTLVKDNRLKFIKRECIMNITNLVKKEKSVKENTQIFCDLVINSNYFLKSPSEKDNESKTSLTNIYQLIFRTMAAQGFIKLFFEKLLIICENVNEDETKRYGALFWAKKILDGFITLNDLKKYYEYTNYDDNTNLTHLNTVGIPKEYKEYYLKVGIEINNTLIFGTNIKRPWSLTFTKKYVEGKLENINECTFDVMKKCIQLIHPAISKNEEKDLINIMSIYLGKKKVDTNTQKENDSCAIYTLEKDILNNINDNTDVDMVDCESEEQSNKRTNGIWSELPDGMDWHTCPLGKLMWQ